MNFENSEYAKHAKYRKEAFEFGNLYITKKFVISEINEGVHVDYDTIAELLTRFSGKITKDTKLGYIANRLNSYSVNPKLWDDFSKEYDLLVATAIVYYNDISYKNATLEKHFFNKSLKRCKNLNKAIDWMDNLEEFNE